MYSPTKVEVLKLHPLQRYEGNRQFTNIGDLARLRLFIVAV